MKPNLTRLFLFMTAAALFYTSCKKGGLQPLSSSTKNLSADSAAAKIASGLVNSLNGTYGGVNLNDGIKTPANFTASHTGPVIQSTDPMCGFTIDSAYSYFRDLADVATNHYWGRFKFTYTCSSSYLDGYEVIDSVNYRTNNTNAYKLYATNQDFIVKALDNTYKRVSMNGFTGGKTETGLQQSYGPVYINTFTNKYTYSGVTVDFSTGNAVMKGTVPFTSTYSENISGISDTYTGNITFPGDGISAELSINIHMHFESAPRVWSDTDQFAKYKIDLATGALTLEK